MNEPVRNFVIPAATPKQATVNLEDEEQRLLRELAEIRRKRFEAQEAEKIRLAEEKRNKPVVVRIKDFAGGMVIIEADYRDDLLALWQSAPGRMYRGGENAIPVGDWNKFIVDKLKVMPKVEVVYAKGVEEAIDFHLNAPTWMVELTGKSLKLTPGPRYDAYAVNQIPGVEWAGLKRASDKFFLAPLSEAWRVYEALLDVEGVLYSDEARDFTINQVEMRKRLDEIGLAESWEYPVELAGGNKLRPFQNVGCAFIEATGGKALLAYEMGLGKTPMSVAYAWKNKFRTIVICPASLKANWCRQIFKFTGVQPNVLTGAEPSKYDLITLLTSPSLFTVINYDIVGRKIEYDDVKQDTEGYDHVEHKVKFLWIEALNMARPDLIICDESHYIKNTDSNRSQAVRLLTAPRIVHMTGTPVLNRPGELWPMLTMLAPATFPSEELFINQYTTDGKKAKNVDKLRESLKSIMIRRRQCDVVKDMPPLNRIVEYHELSPKARKLYMKVLNGVYEKIEAFSNQGQHGGEMSVAGVLAQITRLKQVCAIDKVDRSAELATELHESSSEERHNKVLIFSQFKAPAFAIAQRLGHQCLSFVSRGRHDFATANDAERDRLVQQFQSDPNIKYLVGTEKTLKEGHDCTEAGFVVFNDLFWTPANHQQCEGRAFMRVLDPHGISSYYTIVDSEGGTEIEEWIWELLEMKTDVIDETVEGVESSRDVSVAMALIEKMKESMWSRKKR